MSLIHPLSAPAAPACLEVFLLPETQAAILNEYDVYIQPISSQPGGPYEFNFNPRSGEYNKTNEMKLTGKVRVLQADGTLLSANEVAVLSNLFLYTMFRQCDVRIGNGFLSLPHQMFHIKCMIKTLLRNGKESKDTQLAAQGYYKETAQHFDSLDVSENKSLYARYNLFKESQYVDFEGRLLEDCLELDRYLLNDVPINIKLTQSSPEFAIMAKDKTKKYKFEISDLNIKMRMVTVTPGVIIGHSAALKEQNAIYPFIRAEIRDISIAKGETFININDMSTRSVPSRVVFGIVSTVAYNGAYDKNPFNFEHHNVSNVSLVVNENIIGGRPLNVDFTSGTGKRFAHAYTQMFTTTGKDGKDVGIDIKLSDYPNGYCLFCFNLEPFNQPGQYFNLVKTGFVRLSIQFSTPLENTAVLILYSEYQDLFQIDAARNVIIK